LSTVAARAAPAGALEFAMTAEPGDGRPPRTLVGATVMQVVPAMENNPAGRAVLDIAVGLLRSGARALVVGGGGGLVGELQAFGGEWMEAELEAGSALRRRRGKQNLGSVIASERVDLVHAHGALAARSAVPAAKSARAPVLTTYVGAPPAPGGWGRPAGDAQARGDLVLACSQFAGAAIAERHRIKEERVVVIPHPVDTGWFDPATIGHDRVEAVRQSWRIRPEANVVLAPGKLTPSHGQFILIDAVRSLVNGGMRGTVFVVAGDDPGDEAYAAAVNARIVAQGLAGIIRRVGHGADRRAASAAADLVVLPVTQASIFNATAAEAQSMGRPVVASQLGAMEEMMVAPPLGAADMRTGWVVEPHDPLALARGIAAALGLAPDELRSVGAQARAFAEVTFSPDRVAAATLNVYGWLLHGGG
jgi:glycosyltransferase involved in cell wall biosynthesis